MLKLNAFGREIPPLSECVNSKELHSLLFSQLAGILHLQQDGGAQHLAQRLFEYTVAQPSDEDAARAVQELLREEGALENLRGGLAERSARILAQIRPHVIGPSILDYGCGDGEVGRRISDLGYTVSLCDIMDYRTEAARRLPWRLLNDTVGDAHPIGDVNSVLLLTVLHHCENPESTLRYVKSLRPRRIVTIESVYDLNKDEVFRGSHIESCSTTDTLEWLRLPAEEQFRYACFWDWFYNKVVNSGVVVPYNYSSPDAWQHRLGTIGYDEVERIYLGLDQQLVPEFHVLQVFDAVG